MKLLISNKNCVLTTFVVMSFLCFSMLPVAQVFSQDVTEVENSKTNNNDSATNISGLTSARVRSLIGGVIGLVSVIIGWRFNRKMKAHQLQSGTWPKIAIVLALLSILLSVIHLITNTGAFGTGGGKAGAIVALVLGLTGTLLNGIVLHRIKKKIE